jgi:predicted NAD/FAD-binding protein
MSTDVVGPALIRAGEVRSVRELKRGVQATVCLGASSRHGSAVITVETDTPEVLAALAMLKRAVAAQAEEIVYKIRTDPEAT